MPRRPLSGCESINNDMRVLVTGSAGHLGEALMRRLGELKIESVGLDILESPFTTCVGSIGDRAFLKQALDGVNTVFHCATLHKPHLETHSRQQFVDTNITGTLNLLEEAVAAGVDSFIYTSTTSVFGDALSPTPGGSAVWVTEDLRPVPKNIYGSTKAAAEDLCQLFHRNHHLACVVLRTSRFFPEEDDDKARREAYPDDNLKMNEFLYRRVDLSDVVDAHLLAGQRSREIGFRSYIISATTPFLREDLHDLLADAPRVVARRCPSYQIEYSRRGWKMLPSIDRVYVNTRARDELGWNPRHDFNFLTSCLEKRQDIRSPLARLVGYKGYHRRRLAG